MNGPLAQLFELLRMRQEAEQRPTQGDPMDPLARMRNPWTADQAPPNLGYRDPMQAGPAPPGREILSAMTKGQK
jgi:hypothetical protein